jgi:hypothetical protein
MRKNIALLLICLLSCGGIVAQSTETFETEPVGATSFSDAGMVFNITSQAPAIFDIYQYSGGGWNGSGSDNRFIDNSGSTFFNQPVQFTISSTGSMPFNLKTLYLFLSKSDLSLNVSGSLTITGKLGGVTKFTATANSPFNTSMGINNGFTLVNMAVFGGANNSNISIDQFTIATSGNIAYVAMDAMTWQCPSVTVTQAAQTNVSCNGGSNGAATVSVSETAGVTYNWTPGNPAGDGSPTVTGLTAGNWTCTVTNGCGVANSTTFAITQPSALSASQSQTNIICGGATNGTATVAASGGSGSYTYSWSPSGATTATATGLSAGNHTVTITDANNCSIQKLFTITSGADCSIATTWNGTSWSNGIPTCNAYTATISGNFNAASNGEITACSLVVNSGSVTVPAGYDFNIKGKVTVSGGSLTFEQNSNLLQSDNIANSGTIVYKRNSSSLYGLDYTLWSSPVSGTQTLKAFSPQTLDARFYVYNTALNAYSNYLSASGIFGANPNATSFTTAKGYLIRMPDGSNLNTPSVFNGTFVGTPNNGNISISLNTQGNRYNAVGNPYPSAINVSNFITANQASLADGTLYFWRKRNASTGTTYATVTLAGYVAGTAEGGDTSAGAFNAGQESNWVINSGQGFIVKAASTANSLNFSNSMRRGVNNGQFFRTGNQDNVTQSEGDASKLWLNITNQNNDFGQTAIAYISSATSGIDYGYDGILLNDGAVSIYSLAEGSKLAIQAREQFADQDEVQLGYATGLAGNYTISLGQKTGVFDNGQHIYIKDNLLGALHNISTNGGYHFTTAAGIFENRFQVVYSSTLGTGSNEWNDNNISILKSNQGIVVRSTIKEIKDVLIFDIQGRKIYEKKDINHNYSEITLNLPKQLLIVKVLTQEGNSAVKKIIN